MGSSQKSEDVLLGALDEGVVLDADAGQCHARRVVLAAQEREQRLPVDDGHVLRRAQFGQAQRVVSKRRLRVNSPEG